MLSNNASARQDKAEDSYTPIHREGYTLTDYSELGSALTDVSEGLPSHARAGENPAATAMSMERYLLPVECPNCQHEFTLLRLPHSRIPIPQYERVPQRQFRPRNNAAESPGDGNWQPIRFNLGDGVSPLSLVDALNGHVDALEGRDDSVLRDGSDNVTVRIEWPGYGPASFPVRTHNWTANRRPITKARLGYEIAKGLKSWINGMEETIVDADFERWKVGTSKININSLYLAHVCRVSKGSWQPELYHGPYMSSKA